MAESGLKITYPSKLYYDFDPESNENSCTKCKDFIEREQALKKWEENLKEREQRIQYLEQKKLPQMKLVIVYFPLIRNIYLSPGVATKGATKISTNTGLSSLNDFCEECDIIQLNVGGWKFATTLTSLRAEKGSVLDKMFSENFTLSRDSDGAVFIDRSGEHFNYILDYLRGNIVGIDDFLFDEKTRKRLIKEAEYYQLEGMKNLLAFKSSLVEEKGNYDCKAEIIEVIENVIQNKEAIRSVLDESKKKRNTPIEGNLASVKDLKRTKVKVPRFLEVYYYRTTIPMMFKNKIWDGNDLSSTHFEHSITFKQCSFVNVKFESCEFKKNVVVSFHQCDLMNTSFRGAKFNGTIHFDGSDLRCTDFGFNNDLLLAKIQNGSVTFDRVKYVDTANFSNKAINMVIKLMNN